MTTPWTYAGPTASLAGANTTIGNGMREHIVVRNFGLDPSPVVVELFCDVDPPR